MNNTVVTTEVEKVEQMLRSMSLEEVNAIVAFGQTEKENKRKETLKNLRAEIKEMLKKNGFTLDDVFPSYGSLEPNEDDVLYQDPNNPKNVWRRKGRMPKWLTEYKNNDPEFNLEDYRVK